MEESGFKPEDLKTEEDLKKIPFIHVNFFKKYEVLSIDREDVVMHATSSGTSGQKSQMFFDQDSLDFGNQMIENEFRYYGFLSDEPTNYLLFTYEPAETSKDLGTAKTDMGLLSYAPVNDTFFALRYNGQGHDFDVYGTIKALEEYEEAGLPVRIFGFPSFLYFTVRQMKETGHRPLKLNKKSMTMLGGGWKGYADKQISKTELYNLVEEMLGIPNRSDKMGKKKIHWQQIIMIGFGMLIGGVCGFLIVGYMDQIVTAEASLNGELFSLAILFLFIYVSIFLHLVIHEAGHLLFGLLSGYKFSSFRIMSFMWIKEGEAIKLKRYSLAGTGGQCLMSPPDLIDGKIPVMLYNFGGALLNLIVSVSFILIYMVLENSPFWKVAVLIFILIGFVTAFINGIPMRTGAIDNDGYNAFSLSKDKEALRSFWVQMKIAGEIAKGARLKDMPEEWFTVPTDDKMKNTIVAVMGVFACNRLMDEKKFEEADGLMEHLMKIESGINGLHRYLMTCDRMYCELISENRPEVLDRMYSKELKKLMKQMKTFPSIIRTEYVYALLSEKDERKVRDIKKRFEKCTKTYPYEGDIQSEQELMEIAEMKLQKEVGENEV